MGTTVEPTALQIQAVAMLSNTAAAALLRNTLSIVGAASSCCVWRAAFLNYVPLRVKQVTALVTQHRFHSVSKAIFRAELQSKLMATPLVIIPARLASTRLPGKPLADIAGKPMIIRVLEAALAADIGPVVVAAAEQSICDTVQAAGGNSVLTDPALPSGSDRVWHATQQIDPQGKHDLIINLQGDLPTFPPAALHAILKPLAEPWVDLATLVTPILSEEEKLTSSVVKVACDFPGNATTAPALYFSRMPLPWGEGPLWHHVGVYGWRRDALQRFVSLPESGLEKREKLEQLRALEAGMRIGCAKIDIAPFGVDTPADLERARQAFGA